jgi:murein DD-endopeptidase MepM/ murein hydrolase activator NlpD
MLDVRSQALRRWAAAITAVAVAAVPTTAAAAPGAPGQTEPTTDERASETDTLVEVDVDVLVSTDASAVATTLTELGTQVREQLAAYTLAEAGVAAANQARADADAALQNTEFRIEETTSASDEVVIEAFINPPAESALEVLAAETPADATVKHALLNMDADRSADSLTDLQDALADYEVLKEEQEEALNAAETARAEAEASLADLDAALSAQAQFVTEVQTALATQSTEPPADPETAAALATRQGEIMAALSAAAEEQALRDAQAAAEEARRRRIEAGLMFCPVDGNVSFTDTWGAPRSGGRTHKGVDMMASHGTPTVAPVSGQVEHRGTSLGGLSWYVYGDNGNTYYGTHLQSFANQGAGWVEAGTLIGYVGSSGNADSASPHLHFEIHPGGGEPVNPYPLTNEACPR